MKIKHLFVALLAAATVFGCQKPEDKGSESAGKPQYMAFQISVPATKAGTTSDGGYQFGSDGENDFKSIYFFFYKDGAYIGWGKGAAVTSLFQDPKGEQVPGTAGGSVEEIWRKADHKGVVVIESSMNTKPNQVLCIVNSPRPTFFRNKTLSQAVAALQTGVDGVTETVTNDEIGFATVDGSKAYFCMANAPTIKNGKVEYALSFDPTGTNKKIYDTVAEAENDPLEIYVERMAAKVEVTSLTATMDTELAKDWEVKLDNWAINCVSKNSYVVKNIDASWIAATATEFAGWVYKASAPYRVNWAIDPDYSAPAFSNRDYYPHSAEDWQKTSDLDNVTPRVETSIMKYYSKNELDVHAAGANVSDSLRRKYILENTFNEVGQNEHRATGANMMVLATVKPKGAAAPVDLFNYMDETYTLKDYAQHLLANALDNYDFFLQEGTSYTQLKATDLNDASKVDAILGLFEIKKAVKGETFNTDGYFKVVNDTDWTDGMITLYPKSTTQFYEYDATSDTYNTADPNNVKAAFLHDIQGLANGYKNGMMWYSIPVEHLGKAQNTDNTPKTGNWGVVRNNWYQITLGTIKTLGHGIWDDDEPIVPGLKDKMWYIGAKINVNAWNIVNQTSNLEE